jgi:homoserine O-succinyltransferase
MSDGALAATERQFFSLLSSASDGIDVCLSLFSLPDIPRSEAGGRYVESFYSSTAELANTKLDALIITGREPLTPALNDEPYWDSFTSLLDWARENTISTVCSCLAAHAALLHRDGIGRIRSQTKHFGVFECERVTEHPLTSGSPSRFNLPHSRWNGISEDALTSCGYSVLTRSAEVGVDTFVKHDKSLLVCYQGHPEYHAETLLLEYRRDVDRFLKGKSSSYPRMPRSYFNGETAEQLAKLQEEAQSCLPEDLLDRVTDVLRQTSIEDTWHSAAKSLYRNWLEYICAQKQLRLKNEPVPYEQLQSAVSLPQSLCS